MIIMDVVKGLLAVMFGILLILAGVFNWKRILFMTPTAEVIVEYIGMTLYRAMFIILGVAWLIWLIVGVIER